MKKYSINNKSDIIEFKGTLLSHVSSRQPEKHQWTEILIYKTEGGKYVVHRIGNSVRYHVPEEDGGCETREGRLVSGDEVPSDFIPCPTCDPEACHDDDFLLYDYIIETPLSSADVADTPSDVRKCLLLGNQLTGLAYSALQEAVRKDQSLLGALRRRVWVV